MAKYLLSYNSAATAGELMANASPEEIKASMNEWMEWREEASKAFSVDFGLPIQVVSRITPDGITESDNKTSGYSIVEGNSQSSITELLRTHPHLKREGASIDILEMLSMPGL